MRAVVIPENDDDPIREVDVAEGDGGSTLDALQKLVGGNIEALPWPGPSDTTTYVNEDGKYTCERNERASLVMKSVLFKGDYISGPLVVIGFDARRGTNKDLDATLAERLVKTGEHLERRQ